MRLRPHLSLICRPSTLAALIFLALLAPARLAAQSDTAPNTAAASPSQEPAEAKSVRAESPLDALQLARRSIEKYFEQATNVVCLESVTHSILNKDGKSIYKEESSFEDQLQSPGQTGALHLVESRTTRKASFRDPGRTLLITTGFSSMLLIVHPDYEPSYTFENSGELSASSVRLRLD